MKVRLYVRPPGSPSTLLEADLPEEADAGSTAQLRCFCPPPGDQGEAARFGAPRAWTVDLEPDEAVALSRMASDIRVAPFGDATPKGGGTPVELSLSSGQAEARISWWIRAPSAWTAIEDLVRHLIHLSQRDP